MSNYQRPVDAPISCSWACHLDRDPPSSEAGTDYACAYGTPVRAVAAGTVTYVKHSTSGAMGRVAEYRLDDGRDTRSIHLSEVWVDVGQRVERGQQIALSGASGFDSDWGYAAHLHHTLWPGPAWAAPTIDFERYVGEEEEDDMPLTDDEIHRIAAEVWGYSMSGSNGPNDDDAVATETGGERLRNIRRSTNGIKGRTVDTKNGVLVAIALGVLGAVLSVVATVVVTLSP